MANLSPYQPLYTTYRPQQFADLVGQEAITQTLQHAITSNALAHAYLFCGPRGTGKTSTARILAKSINCEQGPTVTPCQTCASCAGITAGNGLDVIEIDAASHNGVDEMRELIETCQFSPMMGRYKIYIIDEVHMLSTQAFNALLKTLEEPPPSAIFIFATTEAHKVLPTIISRCQRYDFSRIKVPQLVPHLATIANKETIRIDDDALLAIARHARGGLRDALSLLDQVGVLSRAQQSYTITLTDVNRFLGGLSDDTLITLLTHLSQQNVGGLLTTLDTLQQDGIEPRILLQGLTQAYRNLMLLTACPKADADELQALLGVSQPVLEQLQPLATHYTTEEYPQILAQFSTMEQQIRFQANPQLWVETGLTQLAFRDQLFTLNELNTRITQLENALQQGGTTPAPTTKTPAPTKAPATATAPISAAPAPAVAPQPAAPPIAPMADTPPTPAPPPAAPAPSVSAAPADPSTPINPMPSQPPAPTTPATPVQPLQTTPEPSTEPSTPSTPPVAGGLTWGAVLQHVENIPTKTLLTQQASLLGQEGNVVIVGCKSQGILNTLKNPKKLEHLQKAIQAASGEALDVRLDVGMSEAATPSMPSPMPPPAPTPQPNNAETTAALSSSSPTATLPEPMPPSEPPPATTSDSHQHATVPAATVLPETGARTTTPDDNAEEWAEAKQHVAQLMQGKPV